MIVICLLIVIGEYWGCFRIFMLCLFFLIMVRVVVLRLELNFVNVFSLWYCVWFSFRVLDIFFIDFICVELFIWFMEIFMLIVGWILVLNRLDLRKIWLLVIEIMLVGIYVEMLFVCVLMIGSVVRELLFFMMLVFFRLLGRLFMFCVRLLLVIIFVVCFKRWLCR